MGWCQPPTAIYFVHCNFLDRPARDSQPTSFLYGSELVFMLISFFFFLFIYLLNELHQCNFYKSNVQLIYRFFFSFFLFFFPSLIRTSIQYIYLLETVLQLKHRLIYCETTRCAGGTEVHWATSYWLILNRIQFQDSRSESNRKRVVSTKMYMGFLSLLSYTHLHIFIYTFFALSFSFSSLHIVRRSRLTYSNGMIWQRVLQERICTKGKVRRKKKKKKGETACEV